MLVQYYYCKLHERSEVDEIAKFIRNCSVRQFYGKMSQERFKKIFLQNEITQVSFVENGRLCNEKIMITCTRHRSKDRSLNIDTYITKLIDPNFYGVYMDIEQDNVIEWKSLQLIEPHITQETYYRLLKK